MLRKLRLRVGASEGKRGGLLGGKGGSVLTRRNSFGILQGFSKPLIQRKIVVHGRG